VSGVTFPGPVVDTNAGFTLSWSYLSAAGTACAHVAIQRQLLGGTIHQWYRGGASWGSSEAFFTWSSTSITFAPGDWTNGPTWLVSVAAIDTNGAVGAYAPAVVVQSLPNPALTFTNPSGATFTNQQIGISWVEIGTQTIDYQLTVEPVASITQGTDIYGQPLQYLIPTYVANGPYEITASYTDPTGRIAAATYTFTMAATLPATPTLSVSASTYTQTPAVTLTITSSVTGTVVAQRSTNGGTTWTQIRATGAATATVPFQIVDAEVPAATSVIYQAAVQTATAQSAWSGSSSPVTLNPLWWTLSDPLTPGSAISVSLQPGNITETGGERQAAYDLMGIGTPTVLADAIQASNFSLPLFFYGETAYQNFLALRASQHVLLLQAASWGAQWYIRLGPSYTSDLMLASARSGGGTTVTRAVSITAQVVAPPVGLVAVSGFDAGSAFDSGSLFDG
jgi:hypothetical protein